MVGPKEHQRMRCYKSYAVGGEPLVTIHQTTGRGHQMVMVTEPSIRRLTHTNAVTGRHP